MKTLLLYFSLISSILAIGQDQVPVIPEIPLKKGNMTRLEARPDGNDIEYKIFGDFVVSKLIKVEGKRMNEIEQSLLLGSFIRVQETSITGNEISPMSFEIYETENMARSDYIFREFGDDILLEIEDLPLTVSVFKTDHTECYGIINLGYGGVW